MEDEESLETSAIISDMTNFVHHLINQFLADGIMSTSIVVRSILLPRDHLLWVKKVSVCAGADFVYDIWLQVAIDGSRNIFPLACGGKY